MARKVTKRAAPRNSNKRTKSVVETQKVINRDYRTLFRDYEKLALKLWRKPAARYIASGAAVAALIPVAMRIFRNYPQVNAFVRESLDSVEERLETVGERISDKISELRSESEDEFADARH